ncbi:hypothetical protein GLV89_01665 [Halomonas alkaliantarctica]|nr:hypothetical protein [Halomonas alkaliantarctica]
MSKIQTTDPATGEIVTIPQLAKRYSIRIGTLHWRHSRGRRGWDLVAPLNEHRGSSIRQGIAKRREMASPERRELIQAARTHPLTRPFSQLGKEAR